MYSCDWVIIVNGLHTVSAIYDDKKNNLPMSINIIYQYNILSSVDNNNYERYWKLVDDELADHLQ